MRSVRIASLSYSTSRSYIAPALIGVLSLSLLAGCGGGGGNGNSNPGTTTTTGGSNNTTDGDNYGSSVSVTTTSGLVATLSEPSINVGVGGTVVYTVSITNPTASAVTIQSASQSVPSMPAATLTVRDAAGNQIYSPPPLPPALFTVPLLPGQTVSTTVSVSTFAAQGTYSTTANFAETIPATTVGPLTVTAR